MSKTFRSEFLLDVVAVARQFDVPISQAARDFGTSESCLQGWLKLDGIEEGHGPGVTQAESVALREAISGFAYWSWSPVSLRDWDDAHPINAAMDVHADDLEFGYRLITDELFSATGFAVGENGMARLCSLQRISYSIINRYGPGSKLARLFIMIA